MDIEGVTINEGDVIVIHDRDNQVNDFDSFAAELHTQFPKNLVVWFSGESTLETMPLNVLKQMMADLIEHEEAVAAAK